MRLLLHTLRSAGLYLTSIVAIQAAELSLSQFSSVTLGQAESQVQHLVGAADLRVKVQCAHGSGLNRQAERWAWYYLPAASAADPQISTFLFEQGKLISTLRTKRLGPGVDAHARGQATIEAVRRIHNDMGEGEVRSRLGLPDRIEQARCVKSAHYDVIKRLVYLAVQDDDRVEVTLTLRAGRVTDIHHEHRGK